MIDWSKFKYESPFDYDPHFIQVHSSQKLDSIWTSSPDFLSMYQTNQTGNHNMVFQNYLVPVSERH